MAYVDFGGKATFGLRDPDERGRWTCDRDPSISVSFNRDDAGEVKALVFHKAGRSIENSRKDMTIE